MPIAYLPAGRKGRCSPDQAGPLKISPNNVMITGLTWAREGKGVILRLREFDGRAAKARVVFGPPWNVRKAQKVDLLENSQGELPVKDNQLRLGLRPFEMVTLRLSPFAR